MLLHPVSWPGPAPARRIPRPLRAAGPLLALAAAALLLDALPGLPWAAGPAAAAPFLAAGLVRAWQARAARDRLRTATDQLLLRARRGDLPPSLAWRIEELVRAAERERLAGALWQLAASRADAAEPLGLLALRLAEPRPVSPRGVLLVHELLDGRHSPLGLPAAAPGASEALRDAALAALAALEVRA